MVIRRNCRVGSRNLLQEISFYFFQVLLPEQTVTPFKITTARSYDFFLKKLKYISALYLTMSAID